MAFMLILVVLILHLFLPSLVISVELCSNIVNYNEADGIKAGNFDVDLPFIENNTYLRLAVFISDLCQPGLCTLNIHVGAKNLNILYRTTRTQLRQTFSISFVNESRQAIITGIGLQTSFNCYLVCNEIPGQKNAKSVKYSLYPFGHRNAVRSECNLKELLSQKKEICGTVSPLIEADHAPPDVDIVRGSWPWLVGLYLQFTNATKFICGGTLVSNSFVLTAAHCLHNHYNYPARRVFMLLGKYDITDWNEEGCRQYMTKNIFIHPDYRRGRHFNFDADVALLQTAVEVEYTNFIRPACIWHTSEKIPELAGQQAKVTGWGRHRNGEVSRKPKQIEVNVANDDDCLSQHEEYREILTHRNFCAVNMNETAGPCKGDSGGALMIHRNEKWFVRGVVSGALAFSDDCDLANHVIYTDVQPYEDWINIIMNSN